MNEPLDLSLDLNLDFDMDLDLDLHFDFETENPLDKIKYTGNLEKDSSAEMESLLRAFIKKKKTEIAREKDIFDSRYWFCVIFQSRAQKAEFLRALPGHRKGSPEGTQYVDGLKLARDMGIKINDTLNNQTPLEVTKNLSALAMGKPKRKKR